MKRFVRMWIIRYIQKNFGYLEQDGIYAAIMSKEGFRAFRKNVNQWMREDESA